jgi:hypothetical protein
VLHESPVYCYSYLLLTLRNDFFETRPFLEFLESFEQVLGHGLAYLQIPVVFTGFRSLLGLSVVRLLGFPDVLGLTVELPNLCFSGEILIGFDGNVVICVGFDRRVAGLRVGYLGGGFGPKFI